MAGGRQYGGMFVILRCVFCGISCDAVVGGASDCVEKSRPQYEQ